MVNVVLTVEKNGLSTSKYSDPDESRTPAAIWHKVLVSMCDFFLRDVSNEGGDGNNAENSDTENSGNESDDTDAMDMENIVPESSTNEVTTTTTTTSTKSYRLRQSTKMKKIVLEMDEESMKVMRRDREEWRWIRDVAG